MRVAISTGGGDAPGLNSVIRAATLAALRRGWDVVGIRDAFNGLLFPEQYPQGGVVALTRDTVRGIAHLGGTILGSTNAGDPTNWPVTRPDGTVEFVDRTSEVVERFQAGGIDALITIGGDGSLTIGRKLSDAGLRVIGVPKTIDNDLDLTEVTFGFDTAVGVATEGIGRLFTTAASHSRIFVVEVMGRYAGWIALHAGLAAAVHAILIPEIPYDLRAVARMVAEREARGIHYAMVVVAEGATPRDGQRSVRALTATGGERLGGAGERVAAALEQLTGRETRTMVLGHLLRGGTPTSADRLLGLRFGAAAVRALEEGHSGVMVALRPPRVAFVPLVDATSRLRTVPLDGDTILAARDLGVYFGDEDFDDTLRST